MQFWVVARQTPSHRAAPVMPDPYRALSAECVERFNHVYDCLFERIVLLTLINASLPEPRMSGAIARKPSAAKTGSWLRGAKLTVWGKPMRRTAMELK